MDEKTIQEKAVIALLRKNWPEFPKGKLVKSESPDFILRTSRKFSIGIEITRADEPISKSSKGKYSFDALSDQPVSESKPIVIRKAQLDSALKRKEEKLGLYRKNMADAYWLIITVGQLDGSSEIRVSQNLSDLGFETAFQRLFLILLPQGKIIGLK